MTGYLVTTDSGVVLRKRIANLTSNILNPFLVSLVLILLISFQSTSGVFDAVKWSLIMIAVGILPVFLVIVYLVRHQRIEGSFIDIRKQRTGMYLLAGGCTIVSYIALHFMGAPPMLMATSAAGLSAVVIFMGINLWWKISLHTAFVAASVTMLVILYGPIAVVSIVLVPLIGWSRIELKHHSIAQVIAGAFLSALIVGGVFYFWGLL